MKALIFGCGYLGRRVASAWIQQGYAVAALTRSPERAREFQESGIVAMVGDVCEPASLDHLPDVDVVLYAVGFDRLSNRLQRDVTCGGIQNVLDRMKDQYRHFIYVSSTSVYGQSNGEWVDESSDCLPNQPGGQFNLIAEELVRDRFPAESATKATVLRLAGIYGKGRLLARRDALQAGEPIAGRSDSWLNLIHVDDATRAIIECAAAAEPGTFNVVDDQPIPRREYFEQLATLVSAPPPRFDDSLPNARGAGGLNKRCSNRKLKDRLGWTPQYLSIATGLPVSI